MATRPRYIILLTIISNNIPLGPLITLIDYFIPKSLYFEYIKPY